MRFLADEGCDEDTEVLDMAFREERIVLTEDKDFGQLVYAHSKRTRGVIFLRYPASARQRVSKEVAKLVKEHGEELSGCFVVVQPGRVRISRTSGG